ncbi:MAG: hypothetical protein IBX50_06055 [Marinospirillum sp.]|uniref:hypothetical protein n=1 Tax=Marinospirillum sp. TaxID=2183934 RepID=UPI001A09906D|nr:hypothetical protein [Marinospirillum sp.]MBE0506270.1 hypothetical protein [Marinospirillum sp.]
MSFSPKPNAVSASSQSDAPNAIDFPGEVIPSSESIRSTHIESLKNLSNLTIGILLGALGLSTQRGWYEVVNKDEPMQPADKIIVASLVRWYLRHPEYLPKLHVDYPALFERINRLLPEKSQAKESYEIVFHRKYETIMSYAKVGQQPDQDVNQMCLMMQSMSDDHLVEFWNMALESNPSQISDADQWRFDAGKRPLHKRRST